MDLLFALCLAVGLGACAGLRAFLPLFLLGLAVRMQFPLMAPVPSQEEVFLASDLALIVFGILAALESLLDAIPLVDHSMQVHYFALRPLAGAFVALSVLDGDKGLFWFALLVSLLVGVLVSLPVHTASTSVRVFSTVTTAGVANPVVSVKETLLTLFGVLAFLVMAPVALAGALLLAGWMARWFYRKLAARRSPGYDYVPIQQ